MSTVGNSPRARPPRASADGTRSKGEGFSLVELLIALAIAATLLSVAGTHWHDSRPGPALIAAQQTISALVVAARVEAAASGQSTRLVVTADHAEAGDAELRLRCLRLVRRAADGSWRQFARAVMLPRPVLVVPPSAPPVVSDGGWGTAPVSTFAGQGRMALSSHAGVLSIEVYYLEFSPRGTSTVGTLVLAPGESAPRVSDERIRFLEPRDVRGIKLSQYGTQTLLDHADAF